MNNQILISSLYEMVGQRVDKNGPGHFFQVALEDGRQFRLPWNREFPCVYRGYAMNPDNYSLGFLTGVSGVSWEKAYVFFQDPEKNGQQDQKFLLCAIPKRDIRFKDSDGKEHCIAKNTMQLVIGPSQKGLGAYPKTFRFVSHLVKSGQIGYLPYFAEGKDRAMVDGFFAQKAPQPTEKPVEQPQMPPLSEEAQLMAGTKTKKELLADAEFKGIAVPKKATKLQIACMLCG